MSAVGKLSIRTILGLVISTMGLLLVGLSAKSMLGAIEANASAARIAKLSETSQLLFNTLIPTRNEQGTMNTALIAENPIAADAAAGVLASRAARQANYAEATKRLAAVEDPALTQAVVGLKAAYEAFDGLDRGADVAARQPKTGRDASLAPTYKKNTLALLDALAAMGDRLEASLQLSDPVVDHFLAVKRAAWVTRLNLGLMANRTQVAVALGKVFETAEALAWWQNQARAATAWALVTQAAARPDAPRTLVERYAAANQNFAGQVADERKMLVDALSAGQRVARPVEELQKADIESTGLVVDVANAALDLMVGRANAQMARAANVLVLSGAVLLLAVILVAAGLIIVSRRVSRPIQTMTAAMRRLAAQDFKVDIPGADRHDEIGAMAAAVQVFKTNALHALDLEQEKAAVQQRRLIEDEMLRREAEQAAAGEAAALIVSSIGTGLARLAAGDLTYRLEDALPGAYEKLRTDMNLAFEHLQDLVRSIAANTATIRSGTSEIAQVSEELSRRTQQQAATLEEAAAALADITQTVRKTAEGAERANKAVALTGTDIQRSGTVVREAVAAMAGIERSSQQIDQIIGLIDEIAFQTNLLALNAGIEAARAGDTGRGFAVVASEVRALAQRSATAAKEIKALVSTSSRQVEIGVRLVAETGEVLGRVEGQIGEIIGVVSEIAASAQVQASGMREVNTAIDSMDQTTRQNAAMVEQSTETSQGVAHETALLVRLTRQFTVGDSEAA